MRSLWKRMTQPYSWFVPLAVFLLVLAVCWAVLGDSLRIVRESIGSPNEESTAKELSDERLVWGLMFGHPWLALTMGLAWGVALGAWDRSRINKHFDLEVERVCLRAQYRPWAALRLHKQHEFWGIMLLFAPLVPAYFLGISLKILIYAIVAPMMLFQFPSRRRACVEALKKLETMNLDAKTRQGVNLWAQQARFAGAVMCVAFPILAVATSYVFLGFSLELRRDAADIHEHLRSHSATHRPRTK